MKEEYSIKPECYNRPPFKDTVIVRDGWLYELVQNHEGEVAQISVPRVKEIPDPMSKGCHQHEPDGEATLHPEKWDCAGCCWKPES